MPEMRLLPKACDLYFIRWSRRSIQKSLHWMSIGLMALNRQSSVLLTLAEQNCGWWLIAQSDVNLVLGLIQMGQSDMPCRIRMAYDCWNLQQQRTCVFIIFLSSRTIHCYAAGISDLNSRHCWATTSDADQHGPEYTTFPYVAVLMIARRCKHGTLYKAAELERVSLQAYRCTSFSSTTSKQLIWQRYRHPPRWLAEL